jgi:hypothetical protein
MILVFDTNVVLDVEYEFGCKYGWKISVLFSSLDTDKEDDSQSDINP